MPVTMESLGIDRLSIEDRLELVHAIWDSISQETATRPISESRRQELARRAAEDDAFPDDTIPWEQVEREILARVKQA